MAWSRAVLASEVWGWMQRPFAEVGIANADTSGNLKEILDATLSAFDVEQDDLPTGEIISGSERNALTVARYYSYEAILAATVMRVDTRLSADTPNVSRSDNWSQFVENVKKELQRWEALAAPYLPADGSWGSGEFSLGFVPSASDTTETWAEWWT